MVALKTFRFSWLVSALAFLFFIGFTTSFSKLENHQNRQIVIYSIYKNSAIDFMNGNKVYSFTNEEMTEKSLEYAVQNYRWSKGIKTEKPFSFSSASLELDNCLFWKDNFVQFYNKRLAIVDRDLRSTLAKKIVVDYVLIRNNPKISLDNIIQMFDFETIIFDASNSKWKVEMWKEESNQLGISFYDVNELGALIIDVTK